jgi:hypothetical protein
MFRQMLRLILIPQTHPVAIKRKRRRISLLRRAGGIETTLSGL